MLRSKKRLGFEVQCPVPASPAWNGAGVEGAAVNNVASLPSWCMESSVALLTLVW